LPDPPATPPRGVDDPTVTSEANDRAMLVALQRQTFDYFSAQRSEHNGLIADRSRADSPASIAAVGLGISAYAVAVERGILSRADAMTRTLGVLRLLHGSPAGGGPESTGYKGFYYHFLDMKTGARAWQCEVSTIDTALLIAGVLSAGLYFDGPGVEETEIRDLADALYRRVDWVWALNGGASLSHGWRPETGFLDGSWDQGYSEALILYILALGSPTFPIGERAYRDWTRTFERKTVYGVECIYAGPLFVHQLSHIWLDFRGIQDAANREVGFDYFENSRRATLAQRRYAVENPRGFARYSKYGWGLTASDGPGPAVRVVDGVSREFYGYLARGAPFGPDDGTISPWAVVTSLPFAPEAVLETLRHVIERLAARHKDGRGFDASFNPTFEVSNDRYGWVSPCKLGLNEGPIILMIENYLSGMMWDLFRRCPYVVVGLRRAGFAGGWLDA
jgi:hypothetical protein